MRRALVFIAACSSSGPAQLTRPPVPPPPAPDAAPPAPVLGARGDACGERACADLVCAPLPGGYCLSHVAGCADSAAACDGACVETGALGDLCMKRCAGDADCRTDEGYVCDPQWHACVIPNTTAIVPARCAGAVERDAAFGESEAWTDASSPGLAQLAPSAALGRDGSLAMTATAWSPEATQMISLRGPGTAASAESGGESDAASRTVTGSDGRRHQVALVGATLGGYGSAQRFVQYAVSPNASAPFSPAAKVSLPDELLPLYFATPAIAVDDARKWLYIAYVRGARDARWDIVLAASHDAGKTWSRRVLGDPCALDMIPSLALDGKTGTLHVTWYASTGDGAVLHATCPAGAATCRTWGRINSEPFATFSTGRLARTWIGDRASLVIDPARRTLHAVWAQPAASDGKPPATRIFHATAKLR